MILQEWKVLEAWEEDSDQEREEECRSEEEDHADPSVGLVEEAAAGEDQDHRLEEEMFIPDEEEEDEDLHLLIIEDEGMIPIHVMTTGLIQEIDLATELRLMKEDQEAATDPGVDQGDQGRDQDPMEARG